MLFDFVQRTHCSVCSSAELDRSTAAQYSDAPNWVTDPARTASESSGKI